MITRQLQADKDAVTETDGSSEAQVMVGQAIDEPRHLNSELVGAVEPEFRIKQDRYETLEESFRCARRTNLEQVLQTSLSTEPVHTLPMLVQSMVDLERNQCFVDAASAKSEAWSTRSPTSVRRRSPSGVRGMVDF